MRSRTFVSSGQPLLSSLLVLFCVLAWTVATQSAQQTDNKRRDTSALGIPRGKKLVLKDGTYQVIREYQRNGDRVRYYSLERGDWEEIPASMVDWQATEKANAEFDKSSTALAEKIHKQEEAKRLDNVADIDASLPVGEGVFLPSGEGMFVVEGKSIRLLEQVGSGMRTDVKRSIEQVLSPIPIVPGKQTVIIEGAHATLRLHSKNPEFYLREGPPDPDRVSPLVKSSRPGESGPDVELIRAKVTRNKRQLESVSTMFGQEINSNRNSMLIQRWEVAPNVYRFTLGQALPPGEYVLAEILADGLNLYVWDFGVDGDNEAKAKK